MVRLAAPGPIRSDRPQTAYDEDGVADGTTQIGAFPLGSSNLLFRQDGRAGRSALRRNTLGKAGVGGRIVLDPGRRDEPSAPFLAKDQAFGLEPYQCLAHRNPGDGKLVGQSAFRREPRTGDQRPPFDQRGEMVSDA